MYVSIPAIVITYLIIGMFIVIGEMKLNPPPRDKFVAVATFVIVTVLWVPFIFIKAVWGKAA